MFKKLYVILGVIFILLFNACYLILYPQYTPIWFIRLIGLFFIVEAINYFLEFYAKKLKEKKKVLKQQIKQIGKQ